MTPPPFPAPGLLAAPLRCIVHADDYGLTRQITEDILECLVGGCLQSVSVVMGGAYAQECLQAVEAMPEVRVCLHLNVLEGRCVAPIQEVRPLVTPEGFFRMGLGDFLWKLAVGRNSKKLISAVRTEFEAQIDAFTKACPPSVAARGLHLDGHLHVHVIPALRNMMREIFQAHPPVYVRLPQEPPHLPPLAPVQLLTGEARRWLLSRWSRGFAPLLDELGIAHNNWLCGLVSGGRLNAERVSASLESIARADNRAQLVEIMCHPGGMSSGQNSAGVRHAGFYASPDRQREKSMLLDGSLARVLAGFGCNAPFSGRQ